MIKDGWICIRCGEFVDPLKGHDCPVNHMPTYSHTTAEKDNKDAIIEKLQIEIARLTSELADAREREAWICVEERLPEDGEFCWVTRIKKYSGVYFTDYQFTYDAEVKVFRGRGTGEFFSADEIVAWMPFIVPPPPPQAQEG